MVHTVIENVEDRVIRRKIIKTDDSKYTSGYRYSLHHGYTDGRGTILRYDNENRTIGRHEQHTADGVEEIDFHGMMKLRDRFMNEIEANND
ncbi:toxin-antitoxin system TumE family protein [Natrinema caseinilyticum]|uniref:toxin-antitoxin system TumE family protein n=1 Tax=Natrinema caseinilyticum TaxID=2961570 RepID=UPI0020C32FCF|nr:DUF6516 family protein [Natrinema caseinilyticum]